MPTTIRLSDYGDELEDKVIEIKPGYEFAACGDLPIPALNKLRKLMGERAKLEDEDQVVGLFREILDLVFYNRGQEILDVCGIKRMQLLLRAIVQVYGLDEPEGEAGASSAPSISTGEPSRPTSSASTTSTSEPPVSGLEESVPVAAI